MLIHRLQLNLYKRATAHLALGHTKKALDDFEAVLALTEFDQVCVVRLPGEGSLESSKPLSLY